MPAGAREALIAYLESGAVERPVSVTSKTTFEAAKETGKVTATITHGELFLHPRGRRQERYRLRWSGEKDRVRTLPVGTYRVTGYRHVKKAKDGAEWIWSTTSPGYAWLEVKPDETAHFEVRRALVVKARAFEKKGKHRVSLVFRAEKRLGNTLYRNGRRIGIQWQLLDAEGGVLSKGAMRYG